MQGVKYPKSLLTDPTTPAGLVFLYKGNRATKAGLKKIVTLRPDKVVLIATSVFGNEYDGRLSNAPDGSYTVVGPNAYTARDWFATIVKKGDTYKVS